MWKCGTYGAILGAVVVDRFDVDATDVVVDLNTFEAFSFLVVCEDTDGGIKLFIACDESAVIFDDDLMKMRLVCGHDDPDRAFVECEFFEDNEAEMICECVLVAVDGF